MREILLTSSVLILAVLLLRLAFRDRISRRAQRSRSSTREHFTPPPVEPAQAPQIIRRTSRIREN